jgi:cob(I)alamin adenosyltransferase
MSTEKTTDQHNKMAEKRNAGYEKKQAKATLEKGLVIINTGTGKGKTTAAFGMAMRAVGHGMKVGVVQFIKGAMDTAERSVMQQFDNVEFHAIGDGFTWLTQDHEKDVATAQKAWAIADSMIRNPEFDFIVLDELNVILKYDFIAMDLVLDALAARAEMQHVVITGRHAKPELIEVADLVSEIKSIKHPYKEQGIKAQKGVEF